MKINCIIIMNMFVIIHVNSLQLNLRNAYTQLVFRTSSPTWRVEKKSSFCTDEVSKEKQNEAQLSSTCCHSIIFFISKIRIQKLYKQISGFAQIFAAIRVHFIVIEKLSTQSIQLTSIYRCRHIY